MFLQYNLYDGSTQKLGSKMVKNWYVSALFPDHSHCLLEFTILCSFFFPFPVILVSPLYFINGDISAEFNCVVCIHLSGSCILICCVFMAWWPDVVFPNIASFVSDRREINLTHCNILFPGKLAPGCYTLAVSEALPEEMQVNIFTSLRNLRRD